MSMKRCPQCAEKIHHTAIVCRYCGANLQEMKATSFDKEDVQISGAEISEEKEVQFLVPTVIPDVEKKARRKLRFFRTCSILLIIPLVCLLIGWVTISLIRNKPAARANLAINPPGRILYIASHTESAGEPGIFIINADGSDRQQLVGYTSDINGLSVSPDGHYAVFTMEVEPYVTHIFRVDLNSGEVIQLTDSVVPDDDFDYTPSRLGEESVMWSPMGGKLVFIDDFVDFQPDGEKVYSSDIVVMNDNGSNLIPITSTVEVIADEHTVTWWLAEKDPIWSPDGTQIIYLGTVPVKKYEEDKIYWIQENDREIFIMNADGSGRRQLTDNDAYDGDVAWSPDGRWIAFLSDRDEAIDIYVMDLLNGNTERLTYSSAGNFSVAHPCWSPDGTKLAYSSYDHITLKDSIELYDMVTKKTTMMLEPTNSQIRDEFSSIGKSEFGYLSPEWSPDGAWMLVLSGDRNYAHGLWIVNVNNPSQRIQIDDEFDYIITEAIWVPSHE